MPQIFFGAGALWGTPTTDYAGNAIAVPTPVKFGILQGITLDISFDLKKLHGGSQFPFAVGRGKGSVSAKAEMAQISAALINSLVFGQTLNANKIENYEDNIGTAVPTTPFTITPTPPSSGTWSKDLGVRGAGGVTLTKVASAPATGQYSVSAGVYTFAAADTGLTMFISYQYTVTSTTSRQSVVSNVAMGYAPTFGVDLSMVYGGKQVMCTLPSCISSKFSLGSKLDDFGIPSLDIEGFADANNRVMIWSVTDV